MSDALCISHDISSKPGKLRQDTKAVTFLFWSAETFDTFVLTDLLWQFYFCEE